MPDAPYSPPVAKSNSACATDIRKEMFFDLAALPLMTAMMPLSGTGLHGAFVGHHNLLKTLHKALGLAHLHDIQGGLTPLAHLQCSHCPVEDFML